MVVIRSCFRSKSSSLNYVMTGTPTSSYGIGNGHHLRNRKKGVGSWTRREFETVMWITISLLRLSNMILELVAAHRYITWSTTSLLFKIILLVAYDKFNITKWSICINIYPS